MLRATLDTLPLAEAIVGIFLSVTPSAVVAQQRATELPAVAPLVFDGVTVVDVAGGKLVPTQRVVIVGNRIRAVGPASTVRLPPGARVVAARGQYLIPGLWDLHDHIAEATLSYPLLLANGVTGMRDAWTHIPLDTLVQWRREILAGTRVGPPRQLLTGNIWWGHERLTVEDIAVLLAHGANFIKLYPFNYRAAAAARRLGVPFGGHFGARLLEASDSGMRILDHLSTGGDHQVYDVCAPPRGGSVAKCRAVAERLRHNHSWLVPTVLAAGGAPSVAKDMGDNPQLFDSIVSSLREMSEKFWEGSVTDSLARRWPHGTVHIALDSADTLPDSLRLFSVLERAGFPILAGTDAPGRRPTDGRESGMRGFTLHAELAAYVAGGMSPLAALRTATLNPATMLNATDSLGTVAPGKLADLVLLDGDPLADITNTTTIQAVVANGRYYDRAALDRLLIEAQQTAKRGVMNGWDENGLHTNTTDLGNSTTR